MSYEVGESKGKRDKLINTYLRQRELISKKLGIAASP
jgi:hypothetical protein